MPLAVEIFLDGADTKIRLLQTVSFNLQGTIRTIPAGFISDGQSVPRCLWSLLDPPVSALTLEPSVIHDALYKFQWTSRAYADNLYFELLKNNGYALWKCWVVFAGVRLFGWFAWDKHRKELAK